MKTNPSSSMRAMSPVLNHLADRVGGRLGSVEVALDDDRAAHTQLADGVGSRRQLVAVLVDQLGVERRHDGPARRRLGRVEPGAVGGDDAVRLGQAVARRRGAPLQRTCRSCPPGRVARRAAAAHPRQRARVAGCPVGMCQQLATHRRHAAEVGDTLAFDQLECSTRIPLAHEHDPAAGQRRGVHDAVACGHVEERGRCHEHELAGAPAWSKEQRCRRQRSPLTPPSRSRWSCRRC